MVYVIICDGAIDQMCETKAIAKREVKDLKAMGFEAVKIKEFMSWELAEAFEAKLRGY